MASCGMLRRVPLVRTDVSDKLSASFIRVTRIGEIGTTLAVTSNRRTSVLTRATRRNIPEDAILHSHRRENLKSYLRIHVKIDTSGMFGSNSKGKAVSGTGLRGPQGCETSRPPTIFPRQFSDGGEGVSLTCRPPFTQQEDPW
jgi:hypothetical protein